MRDNVALTPLNPPYFIGGKANEVSRGVFVSHHRSLRVVDARTWAIHELPLLNQEEHTNPLFTTTH